VNNFRTTKKTVPIHHVEPNPWNPNQQSKEIFEKEKASIKELGLLGSILVRERTGGYEILDGEHRWKACKELGYTEITVESIGEIEEKDAKLLTILLNNLHGKDDLEKRAKIFETLDAGQLQLLPFTEEEIENEKALFKFDFSQYDIEVPVDRKPNRLVNIELDEAEYQVWQECKRLAKENDQTEVQMLIQMMEHYVGVNMGSSVGQREQEF